MSVIQEERESIAPTPDFDRTMHKIHLQRMKVIKQEDTLNQMLKKV